jgi:hypothetical protein
MNLYKPSYSSSLLKPVLVLILFSFFFSNSAVVAQKKKSRKKYPQYEFRFRLGTIYDDNILKYSEKYLDRFMKSQDEGRFHIDTYDDLIFFTSLQFSSTFKVFGKQKTKIDAEVSRRTYLVNSIKNWNYFSIGFTQYLPGRINFRISYSYIPDFYVRHFRDDQWIELYGYEPITFQPYAFSKDYYGLSAQKYFFKNTKIKLTLNYATYYHNKHYTEYDSKNWYYGISVSQPIIKSLKVDASYQFVTSAAKGYDASYQTPETTTGPDATYAEDRFAFGITYYLPRVFKRKHNLNFRFTFQNRYYSSKHPPLVDPLHAGRVDKNVRLYFNYNIRINRSIQLKAFYNWYGRNSDTYAKINKQYVSNEKDYRQNIYGLEFTYKLNLKKKNK